MESHEGDYVRGGQKQKLLFGCKSIHPRAREQDLANNYRHTIIWDVGVSLTRWVIVGISAQQPMDYHIPQ